MGGVLLFKISGTLLESKPFKTSHKLSYLNRQNQLCVGLIYTFAYLIKIRTFLYKNDSY